MYMLEELTIYGPYDCPICLATQKYLIEELHEDVDIVGEAVDNQNELVTHFIKLGFTNFPVIAYRDKYYNGIGQSNLVNIVKLIKSAKMTKNH